MGRGGRVLKQLKKLINETEHVTRLISEEYFEKYNRTIQICDGVILGLYEDMLEKTKALIKLIDNDSGAATDFTARSIFENYVYLYYILMDKRTSRLKTESYYLQSKTGEWERYQKYLDEDEEGEELRNFLDTSLAFVKESGNNRNPTEEIEKLEMQFPKVMEKRKRQQKWYYVVGDNTNMYYLCKFCGMLGEYRTVYQPFSDETHSINVLKRFKITEDSFYTKFNIYNNQTQIDISSSLLLSITAKLLEFYGLSKEKSKFIYKQRIYRGYR